MTKSDARTHGAIEVRFIRGRLAIAEGRLALLRAACEPTERQERRGRTSASPRAADCADGMCSPKTVRIYNVTRVDAQRWTSVHPHQPRVPRSHCTVRVSLERRTPDLSSHFVRRSDHGQCIATPHTTLLTCLTLAQHSTLVSCTTQMLRCLVKQGPRSLRTPPNSCSRIVVPPCPLDTAIGL